MSRYLNLRPLVVEELLDATKDGTSELVVMTNEFNELLYDEIIPRLFRQLYDLDESQRGLDPLQIFCGEHRMFR